MSFEAGFREGVVRGPSPCRNSQLINVRSSKTHSAHISGGGALKLSERGGRNAKKRAVVAVARKLAVLLHKLWVSKEVYEPLRNNRQAMAQVA